MRQAGMAELADALDLGSSVHDVQVQVLLPAWNLRTRNIEKSMFLVLFLVTIQSHADLYKIGCSSLLDKIYCNYSEPISKKLRFSSMWRIRQITLYKDMLMNASTHRISLIKLLGSEQLQSIWREAIMSKRKASKRRFCEWALNVTFFVLNIGIDKGGRYGLSTK